MLTEIVDTKEEPDVIASYAPNDFIQMDMTKLIGYEEHVIMKVIGVLVELIVEMAPDVYGPYVVYENRRKLLYIHVLKSLYGIPV